MQPGINNDNFSDENRDSEHTQPKPAYDNKNIHDGDKKEDAGHEENVNDVDNNNKVKNSWDADSKTFNQDKDSWEEENKDAETDNEGTENNNWDANDQLQRSPGYNSNDDETRDAAAGDYIDSDRENYNRNNDRFRWSEPDDEQN